MGTVKKRTEFMLRFHFTLPSKFAFDSDLRILFPQGSCKDKFRQVLSWFSLRQDASETLLKKWGRRSNF